MAFRETRFRVVKDTFPVIFPPTYRFPVKVPSTLIRLPAMTLPVVLRTFDAIVTFAGGNTTMGVDPHPLSMVSLISKYYEENKPSLVETLLFKEGSSYSIFNVKFAELILDEISVAAESTWGQSVCVV